MVLVKERLRALQPTKGMHVSLNYYASVRFQLMTCKHFISKLNVCPVASLPLVAYTLRANEVLDCKQSVSILGGVGS